MSGADYTVGRLKELFPVFGEVKDVVTRKKRGSALVVMASQDAAVCHSIITLNLV